MASTALDRLVSVANLRDVWKEYRPRAKGSAPGVDGITPQQFDDDLIRKFAQIRAEVADGYTFAALRAVIVPKKDPTKFRLICIPTIQDRIVQRALLRVIETKAVSLRICNDVSFGFVKDTPSTKRGTSAARAAAIRHRQAKPWAFKTDITAFFDRINREELTSGFRRAFRMQSLMPLVEAAISCEIDERDPHVRRIVSDIGIERGIGLRQGMPLSPILSNFLLRDFDQTLAAAGYDLVRYADDLIIFAATLHECNDAAALARAELAKLGLSLSDQKTETLAPDEPAEFLGIELKLKPGTSAYCLAISDRQMAKIRDQFTQLHDVDFAVKEGLDLPKLLRRLENMKAGYRTAYRVAENFGDLDRRLDQWSSNCITKIYSSMFDVATINKLTRNQKRFLLLL